MDYARKILQKHGWKEGQGLGKNEKGISKPVKCGLKFDKAGIGYNEKISKESNNQWWIQIFNQAAANISTDRGRVRSNVHGEESKSVVEAEFVGRNLTDEELFQACGGRTAHKAARHGFRLSGKLKRVHQQEKTIEGLNASNEHTEIGGKKRKSKFSSLEDVIENENSEKQQSSVSKKKKKSRRTEDSQAVTAVADTSFRVGAEGDHDHVINHSMKDVSGEEVHSNCDTKKKKSKKMEEFVTCPVVTDSTFPVESVREPDHPFPRKKKRKSVSETLKNMESETGSDISCRKFKRSK